MRYSFAILIRCLFFIVYAKAISAASGDSTEPPSAGKLRAAADLAFSKGEIDNALKLWGKVIDIEPNNDSNFYKRFRVYLRQQKLKEALADLNSALTIKPQNEQALAQRGKLQIRMGKCEDAEKDFSRLRSLNPSSKDLSSHPSASTCINSLRHAEIAFARKLWAEAKDQFTNAIQYADSSASLFLKRAWCSHNMGEMYESIADTGKALKIESDNLQALELRGGSYYSLGELDSAMNHYRQGLKLDPEHNGCKSGYRTIKRIQQLQGKASADMGAQRWDGAVSNLQALIAVDPQHRTVAFQALLDLSAAYRNLKNVKEAKVAAQRAIEMDENSSKGYVALGLAHMENDEFEEATQKFKRAGELEQGSREIEDHIRRAEAALKQSKQKDYYKILGVTRKASVKEIKKAYREQALLWHPDKHTGEEEKAKAEKQFQLIAEAYEVLENPESRQKYDRGEEVFPNQGGQGQQHGNPFQFFHNQGGGHGGGGHQFHFQIG